MIGNDQLMDDNHTNIKEQMNNCQKYMIRTLMIIWYYELFVYQLYHFV
jgi:hypothetical protein